MSEREDRLKKMEDASKAADVAAARLLKEDIQALLDHLEELDSIRPKTTDPVIYQRLLQAVRESTQKNESIAQLMTRIRELGKGGVSLAKTLAGAAKRLA